MLYRVIEGTSRVQPSVPPSHASTGGGQVRPSRPPNTEGAQTNPHYYIVNLNEIGD